MKIKINRCNGERFQLVANKAFDVEVVGGDCSRKARTVFDKSCNVAASRHNMKTWTVHFDLKRSHRVYKKKLSVSPIHGLQ